MKRNWNTWGLSLGTKIDFIKTHDIETVDNEFEQTTAYFLDSIYYQSGYINDRNV